MKFKGKFEGYGMIKDMLEMLENENRFVEWAGALMFEVVKTCRESNDVETQKFCDGMAKLMYQTLTDPRSTKEISDSVKRLLS